MPKKSIKEQLQTEVEVALQNLADAQDSFTCWSLRVTELTQELERLQGALDALEGKVKPTWEDLPVIHQPSALSTTPGKNTTHFSYTAPQEIEINGEKVILEPGFKVAKNSRGEDCIVPEGLEIQPMEEPEKPGSMAFSLPPVTDEDSFQSPESLL